ncbi:DNA-binding protein HEXBP, partial [Aspergillus lentulus]
MSNYDNVQLNDKEEKSRESEEGGQGHLSRERQEPLKENKPCDICGQGGHLTRECEQPLKVNKSCYDCGEGGHLSHECPQGRTGGLRGSSGGPSGGLGG